MKTYSFSNIWEITVRHYDGFQYSYDFVGTEEEACYEVLSYYTVEAQREVDRADYKLAEFTEDSTLCDVVD